MKDYNEIAKQCIKGKLFGIFVVKQDGILNKSIRYVCSTFIKTGQTSKYPFILLNKLNGTRKCDEIASFNNDLSELGFFRIINFYQNIIIK